MFNPLACVSPCLQGGGVHEEDDYASPYSSAPSTPRSYSPTKTSSSGKKKNPYSTLGLDRFSSLLADLEEKRRKISSLVGSHHQDDPYYIHFIYSDSGDWVPIVARLRENNNNQSSHHEHKHKRHKHSQDKEKAKTHHGHMSIQKPPSTEASQALALVASNKNIKTQDKLDNKELERWRIRPSQYLPMILVLILVCLVMFGRSVAILVTFGCWYLVPTINPPPAVTLMNLIPNRPSFVKKEYVRRLSEKNIKTPKGHRKDRSY